MDGCIRLSGSGVRACAWVEYCRGSRSSDERSKFLQISAWPSRRGIARVSKDDAGEPGKNSQVLRHQCSAIGVACINLRCWISGGRVGSFYSICWPSYCRRNFIFVYLLFPASVLERVGGNSSNVPG